MSRQMLACCLFTPECGGVGHAAQGLAALRSEEALLRLTDKMAKRMWWG